MLIPILLSKFDDDHYVSVVWWMVASFDKQLMDHLVDKVQAVTPALLFLF